MGKSSQEISDLLDAHHHHSQLLAAETAKAAKAVSAGKIEAVDHPSHYNVGKIEVIDAIEDWFGKTSGADVFNLGNAIKYIARSPYKGKREEDLKKAIWYLQRALGENRK